MSENTIQKIQQNVGRLRWELQENKTAKTNVVKIHNPLSDLVNKADACLTQSIYFSLSCNQQSECKVFISWCAGWLGV